MLFRRNKNEEVAELDAAWEDENPKPYFAGAAAENSTGELFDAEEIAGETTAEELAEEVASEVAEELASEVAEEDEELTNEVAEVAEELVNEVPEEAAEEVAEESADAPGKVGRHGTGRTSKQARFDQLPEHQKRSRRMRRILTVVVLLLLALLAALGYFGWRLYQESRVAVEAETTEVTTEVEQAAGTEEETTDTGSASTKDTTVPNLMNLLGKTEDEAVQALGSGATVTQDLEISDETSPMMNRVTVVLTEEPIDTKSGVPTVYLGLDTEGKVVIAGYSAATASLGYGTLSFADVVINEHVVERTLSEAGLNLPEGTVELPESSSYSTFASDGNTLVKEQCAFDGSTNQGGIDYDWTSVLVYNYTAANATGNLSDTVRQVYVYVSEAEAAKAASEAKAAVLAERAAEEAAASSAEAAASSSSALDSEAAANSADVAANNADTEASTSAAPEADVSN